MNSLPKRQKTTQTPSPGHANVANVLCAADVTKSIASFLDARSVAPMALASTSVKGALRGAPIDLRGITDLTP